jgi:hypothetical protein
VDNSAYYAPNGAAVSHFCAPGKFELPSIVPQYKITVGWRNGSINDGKIAVKNAVVGALITAHPKNKSTAGMSN